MTLISNNKRKKERKNLVKVLGDKLQTNLLLSYRHTTYNTATVIDEGENGKVSFI